MGPRVAEEDLWPTAAAEVGADIEEPPADLTVKSNRAASPAFVKIWQSFLCRDTGLSKQNSNAELEQPHKEGTEEFIDSAVPTERNEAAQFGLPSISTSNGFAVTIETV